MISYLLREPVEERGQDRREPLLVQRALKLHAIHEERRRPLHPRIPAHRDVVLDFIPIAAFGHARVVVANARSRELRLRAKIVWRLFVLLGEDEIMEPPIRILTLFEHAIRCECALRSRGMEFQDWEVADEELHAVAHGKHHAANRISRLLAELTLVIEERDNGHARVPRSEFRSQPCRSEDRKSTRL